MVHDVLEGAGVIAIPLGDAPASPARHRVDFSAQLFKSGHETCSVTGNRANCPEPGRWPVSALMPVSALTPSTLIDRSFAVIAGMAYPRSLTCAVECVVQGKR